jgi:hypothetical protein
MSRYGARAFLYLGGLCGPEPAKRSRLRPRRTLDHRRGSRLIGSEGRREAANGLLCAFGTAEDGRLKLTRAEELARG